MRSIVNYGDRARMRGTPSFIVLDQTPGSVRFSTQTQDRLRP